MPDLALTYTGAVRVLRSVFLLAIVVLLIPREAVAQDPYKALDLIRPARLQAAKELGVPSLNGKVLRLADYKGKVVFVNFWATWCPPCKEEMPAMERLYQRYKDKGLVVVAVSVDSEGGPIVVPFVKEHKLTFPIGLDQKMAVADRYGVRALPTSFLVNKTGTLVALALGPREWDGQAGQALIESLLK
ncbi:MAG: TlpA family protein disulfide reductase [Candidatus Rokubacteria bacterium]|nr:TlpA family protein disulfide reductase [Candidatus Rokubacteria bacterium]